MRRFEVGGLGSKPVEAVFAGELLSGGAQDFASSSTWCHGEHAEVIHGVLGVEFLGEEFVVATKFVEETDGPHSASIDFEKQVVGLGAVPEAEIGIGDDGDVFGFVVHRGNGAAKATFGFPERQACGVSGEGLGEVGTKLANHESV